ncbi:predicted protein [Chaetoceros tenuissimus]|uniref:Uncharacterized protein n=1 Tax=Chaetoceros tenuissimus TaxID=426638 RepID=A0AAD3D2R9_9STRA|nr:predicted protein [Chaetoceros tenuissimus]
MHDHDFLIKINGEVVYSNVAAELRSEITGRAMKSYLKTKYQWSDEVFPKIDWKSLEAYMKSISQQIRTNVHKLRYGWQFTRQRKNVFELHGKEDFELEDESCPLGCGDTDDTHHFLTCSSQPGFTKSNTELRRLDRFLQRCKTPQPLCHMILTGLRSVLCQGNPVVFFGSSEQEETAQILRSRRNQMETFLTRQP